mmetsp:Transcript_17456/g.22655  ORF Transcript_17456/g.22655 Transcript_17456/m.22655 type:complete len:157 (-) Transcript_17456:71-541(-)
MQIDQCAVINEEKEENQFRFDVRPDCVFYLHDQCRYSDSFCRNKHDPEQRELERKKEKKPCFFHYHGKNGCKYGDECFYSHTFQWVPKQVATKFKEEKELAERRFKEQEELVQKLRAKIQEQKQKAIEPSNIENNTLFYLNFEYRTFLLAKYAGSK